MTTKNSMDYLDARRCIDCDDDVRTKKAFWGCEICGLNTCEECCENDGGHVMCGGCVENMTTCYGCDEWFDNDDLRGICQRENCKIHWQRDDGSSDPRVLCKDCYVNNNPAAEEHEEATTEFARNKICDECGCKGGCELTCVYVCGKKKPKKKKKRKRLVIVDKPKWHQKCSKCDNIKHDCDWVYCLENRAYCGDCSPSSSCDLTYCQACH